MILRTTLAPACCPWQDFSQLPAFSSGAPAPSFAQDVIATADGETTGTRIEITELSRSSGDTVTLKVRLV